MISSSFCFYDSQRTKIIRIEAELKKIRAEDERKIKINKKCPPEGLPVLILNYRKIINISQNDRQLCV